MYRHAYTCHCVPTTPKNKVMYSLRLDPHLGELLKAVKARDGIPESEQIRRALLLWFEQAGVLKTTRRAASKRKR
jgi:hypothetical protein